MPKANFSLICVAHPDDETIFFGGLIQARRRHPWKVVCVTDGNADGQGGKRRKQFERACAALKVNDAQWWGLPDIYEKRLDLSELQLRLRSLGQPKEIFTHGILGEYGHPHHQDVSYAVHQAFQTHSRLYSVAYNAFPELKISLTQAQFEKKSEILTQVYGSETSRFLNLLPATFAEGFFRMEMSELEALYNHLAKGSRLNERALKHQKWLKSYLRQRPKAMKRPF